MNKFGKIDSGRFCSYVKAFFAHRKAVAALVLHASSIVPFHASCTSYRPYGASTADLPEAGVESWAFQGVASEIWQIVAVLRRYGSWQMVFSRQISHCRARRLGLGAFDGGKVPTADVSQV